MSPRAKARSSARGRRASARARTAGAVVAGGLALAAVASAFVVRRHPAVVPRVVDAVRAVVGPRPIAWAEDVFYGAKDAFDRLRYRDAAPQAYWDASAPTGSAPASAAPEPDSGVDAVDAGDAAPGAVAALAPSPFAAPFANVALPGDGAWSPMTDAGAGEGSPTTMWKAMVHPDPKRTYAVVAVVAMDLERLALHSVVGTGEPASPNVSRTLRPGQIPAPDAPDLVAAFNGGWQAIHGHYGMMVDGLVILPPRDVGCTIALPKAGGVRIATWTKLGIDPGELRAWRQTPPCLLEGGVQNPGLSVESTRNWGATVDGETVIRRSAIGLDATGRLLFYGMGDGLTAPSIARALAAAGAHDVAQLDVNWAFPRFLTYEPSAEGPRATAALVPGTAFKPDEYVRRAEHRDFFYVTRKPAAR